MNGVTLLLAPAYSAEVPKDVSPYYSIEPIFTLGTHSSRYELQKRLAITTTAT